MLAIVPAAQGAQLDSPPTAATVPGAHAVHDVLPEGAALPATHAVQLPAPVVLEHVPPAQGRHTDDPAAEYCPGGHAPLQLLFVSARELP